MSEKVGCQIKTAHPVKFEFKANNKTFFWNKHVSNISWDILIIRGIYL